MSLHHVQKGATLSANLEHSLAALIHFLPRTGMEWRGLAWGPQYWLFWPVSPSQVSQHRSARPSGGGAGCSPVVLQSSSLARSLPMGATKIVQRPLQCSPCRIMAEQSWGHRPSSPVWDDEPCPGCSVGAPGQAPAISIPEPPGIPGPHRSRSGIDPGEREHLEL